MLGKVAALGKKLFSIAPAMHVKSFVTFGPYLLLFSLAAALLRFSSQETYLLLATLIGVPFCFKWKMRGLTVALPLIILALFFESEPFTFWRFGYALSIGIGFFITAVSSKEFEAEEQSLDEIGKKHQMQIQQLQLQFKNAQEIAILENKDLQKELSQKNEQLQASLAKIAAYKLQVDTVEKEMQQLCKQLKDGQTATSLEKEELKKTISAQQLALDTLELEKQKLLNQLQSASAVANLEKEEFQKASSLLKEEKDEIILTFKKREEELLLEIESLKAKKSQAVQLSIFNDPPPPPDPQNDPIYKQIRMQFEEKSQVLDETRVELFRVESKLIALQKECEHKAVDASPEEDVLTEQLITIEEENKQLEDQVAFLEELVSILIGKKRKKRTLKPKATQLSLSQDFMTMLGD